MNFFESMLQFNVLYHLVLAIIGIATLIWFWHRGCRLETINSKRSQKGKPPLTSEKLRRHFTIAACAFAIFSITISPLLIRFFERIGWY